MSAYLKASVALNFVFFSSSVFFYKQSTDGVQQMKNQQISDEPIRSEARNKKRFQKKQKSSDVPPSKEAFLRDLPHQRSSATEGLQIQSQDELEDAIEERAEELLEEKIVERSAKRMDHIASRMEEGVRTVAEEFEWEEAQTEQVLDVVMERFDERAALRAEVEAGHMTREEMHEQRKSHRESSRSMLVELVGEDATERLSEQLVPAHWRRR